MTFQPAKFVLVKLVPEMIPESLPPEVILSSGVLANAKEICALAKDLTGVEISLSTRVGGPVGYLRLSATYRDLAEFESAWAKLLASPMYWELVKKGAPFVVADTGRDEIWRSV